MNIFNELNITDTDSDSDRELINESDEHILTTIDKKISLIENLNDYIKNIINNDISENEITLEYIINSLKKIIIYYYIQRIDYDSKYFDPYAYVNDMNENILNEEIDDIDDIEILEHFSSYLIKVIDGIISECETLDSLYYIIKFYYEERYKSYSLYFDNYAFINNLNDILDELEIYDLKTNLESSDNEYSSSSEEETTEDESTGDEEIEDPFLDEFVNEVDNSNIILYNKNKKYEENLNKFLDLNYYY